MADDKQLIVGIDIARNSFPIVGAPNELPALVTKHWANR
jgi:hypothetical protein